jgi:hypothetical protein
VNIFYATEMFTLKYLIFIMQISSLKRTVQKYQFYVFLLETKAFWKPNNNNNYHASYLDRNAPLLIGTGAIKMTVGKPRISLGKGLSSLLYQNFRADLFSGIFWDDGNVL